MACPEPVVCTKKALEQLDEGILVTIVDNEVARDNVVRLARSLNYPVQVQQKENDYYINIYKKQELPGFNPTLDPAGNQVLLVTSQYLGKGSDELGRVLAQSFFYTLAESDNLPKAILFVNSGVKLACEGSQVINSLLSMEKRGVDILCCGTCLDYFKLKDKLYVGSITNMYSIVEQLLAAEKVITL